MKEKANKISVEDLKNLNRTTNLCSDSPQTLWDIQRLQNPLQLTWEIVCLDITGNRFFPRGYILEPYRLERREVISISGDVGKGSTSIFYVTPIIVDQICGRNDDTETSGFIK
jgi:hypothetical protein